MKGAVFNLLELFVVEKYGGEVYEQILEKAKPEMESDGQFVGPGNYSDKDFMSLVKTAVEMSEVPADKLTFAFGQFCFPHLVEKIKSILPQFKDLKSFLKGIDSVIHVEVEKLIKGAKTPKFTYKEKDDGSLVLEYFSPRKMYDFAEGLIQGTSVHFGEDIQIVRALNGQAENETCSYHIKFLG